MTASVISDDKLLSDDELLSALSVAQREQLTGYIDLLLETNAKFNLTAVRDRSEAWDRHVVESLRLTPHLGAPRTLLDVGSGGGLPGMVLAIARPDIQVTLLEATSKKAKFLEETARAIGLSNVHVTCARAEDAGAFGGPLREQFDLVTARAVAALRVLLELTIPFVRPGGRLLAIKGEKADEELADSKQAMGKLYATLNTTIRQPSATLLFIDKGKTTPAQYPRRAGEPKRRPL